jgi:homoserine kinase
MLEVAHAHGVELPPFRMRVANDIPIAKGLGSSASACLAAAAAADFLNDLKLSREDYLQIAVAREGHPDNVAAALYGGLVASMDAERILCSKANFPENWKIVAVTPDYELETKRARKVLPEQVPHRDAVFNVQRAAFLMAQLLRGRTEGVREAMKDRLHQPYRSHLLPGLEEILALDGCPGLVGVALSGAGSTVVAFAEANAPEIGSRISEIFSRHHLGVQVRVLQADNDGLRLEQSGFGRAD